MTHPTSNDELRASSVTIPGRTRYQQFIHREAKRRFGHLDGFLYAVQRGCYARASEILYAYFLSSDIGWFDERIAGSWLKHNRPADPS